MRRGSAVRLRPAVGRRGAVAVSVAGLVALAGCSRDVAVTPPPPDPAATTVCASLAATLPATVDGVTRRTVTPSTPTTAAWGDPPVVLRCGVPRPAALSATSLLTTVDGVDWFAEALTEGVLFTTTGRAARVEVAVPQDHEPAAVLTDLADAIRAADPPVTG